MHPLVLVILVLVGDQISYARQRADVARQRFQVPMSVICSYKSAAARAPSRGATQSARAIATSCMARCAKKEIFLSARCSHRSLIPIRFEIEIVDGL